MSEEAKDNLVGNTSEVATERRKNRSLSDADVDAIAVKLKEHFIRGFYVDIGMGVWKTIRSGLVLLAISIAVYFAAKGQNIK